MKKGVNAPKKQMSLRRRRALVGYSFILPWIIGASVLFIFPLVFSLLISFSKIEDISAFKIDLIGIENYREAFLGDVKFIPMFIASMRDALINLALILVFALFIAILINKKIVFRGFFRSVFFLPVILGTGFIMERLLSGNALDQSTAVINSLFRSRQLLEQLPVGFTGFVEGILSRVTVVFWHSGVQILLFLTGLQGISSSVYEAARVDCASEWEQFWLITLPLIAPVILLNCVYTLVASFTDSANGVLKYINSMAFDQNKMEFSSAMGWIYFVSIFILVMAVFLLMRKPTAQVSES